MEKDTIIKIALSMVLAVYLVFALAMTGMAEDSDRYSSVMIHVTDSLGTGFVNKKDIVAECGDLGAMIQTKTRADIDIDALETHIASMPEVEDANVTVLNNGSVRIDVTPMSPVARVFNPGGSSYYINSSGKRVNANVRYHVDVPVVIGNFDRAGIDPASLLPMLAQIKNDRTVNALVSTVTLSHDNDILIIPVIRGQVINIGDTSNIENKFARLKSFYRQVMPVKGWNVYDTISVKWRGQIVATRRLKNLGEVGLDTEDLGFDLVDDISTMSADSTATI